MGRAGRPLTPINWDDFDKLCTMQCSLDEIASWFNCSIDTIERAVRREKKCYFAEYFNAKRGRGRIALRRKQYEIALSGDIRMLIWLGKQFLGQSERNDIRVEAEISGPGKNPVELSLQESVKNLLMSDDGLDTLNRLETICEQKR